MKNDKHEIERKKTENFINDLYKKYPNAASEWETSYLDDDMTSDTYDEIIKIPLKNCIDLDGSYTGPKEKELQDNEEYISKILDAQSKQEDNLNEFEEDLEEILEEEEKERTTIKPMTKNEQKILEDQVKKITSNLPEKWSMLYDRVSIDNNLPGKILLHVTLSCTFNIENKIIIKTGEISDNRIHMIWTQNTGSGKNVATGFLRMVLEPIKLIDIKDKTKRIPIEIYSIGTITDAGILGDFEYDEKGKLKFAEYDEYGQIVDKDNKDKDDKQTKSKNIQTKLSKITRKPIPVPGPLETHKLIIWEEAEPLIKTANYTEEMHLIAIAVMESWFSPGNTYTKRLKAYHGFTRFVKSEGVLLGTSRQIPNINSFIVESGALQRSIFIARDLEDDSRKKMFDANIGNIADEEKIEEDKLLYKKISDEIQKISDFERLNKISISSKLIPSVSIFLSDKMQWFWEQRCKIPEPSIRTIIDGYLARYKTLIFKLSYHSAAMRYSKNIELCDFEYAIELMKEIYQNQANWLETNIRLDKETREDTKECIRFMESIIRKNGGQIERKYLTKAIAKEFRLTINTASMRVKRQLSSSDSSKFYVSMEGPPSGGNAIIKLDIEKEKPKDREDK